MFDKESSWYGTDSEALSILFAKRCDAVEKKFDNKYREFYDSLERLMDMTYRLACHHVWMFGNPHLVLLPKNHKVIFAALHKNFFVFYSAMALAKKGLFGPSRTLLRHIFEYLMIAKFCAVSEDGEVFRKWEQGDTVYFTNGVLKKIIRPNTREFRDFWEMLCSFSHSTTSSQQVGIDWADEKEIFITFCLIRTLLECHYHLLNSVLITKSMRSFAEQYDYTNELKNLRSEVKKNLVATRIYLGDKAKGLAKDYSLSWKLSPLIDNETNTVLTA